jgi:hypothetical protein
LQPSPATPFEEEQMTLKMPKADNVDGLLEEYAALDAKAETLIEKFVGELAASKPGVPRGVLRTCEIDARATNAYSYPAALRQLRAKL